MQELEGRGGLQPSFKEKLMRLGQCMTALDSLQRAPKLARHEALRVKPKLQGSPLDVGVGRVWNMYLGKL